LLALQRSQPAALVEEDAVRLVEVVADQEVQPAVAGQVREEQTEGIAFRSRQRFRREVAGMVSPQTVHRRSRIEEPRLERRGAGDDVEISVTVDVRECSRGGAHLAGPRQLRVRLPRELAAAVEQDVAAVTPGGE